MIGVRSRRDQKPAVDDSRRRATVRSRRRRAFNSASDSLGPHEPQHGEPRFALAAESDQPARAFGKPEAQDRIEERGKRLDAEHPAPRMLADVGQQRRSTRYAMRMPQHDVELKQRRQPPAAGGGRDLRDVQRRRDRRDADAQPADEAGDHERIDVGRQPRPHRRDEVQDANPNERPAATEAIRRPATEQRPQHRPPQRGAHGDAVHPRVEFPELLNRLLGAGDDDGIEAEEEAGEGGGERPEEEAWGHGRFMSRRGCRRANFSETHGYASARSVTIH